MESLRADVSETRFHSFIPQILSEHLPCAQEKYQVNRWLEYTKWTKVGKNPPPGAYTLVEQRENSTEDVGWEGYCRSFGCGSEWHGDPWHDPTHLLEGSDGSCVEDRL